MAATDDLTARIDSDLTAIDAESEFLPELERDWDEESEGDRTGWRLEWWNLMESLRSLHVEYQAGRMSENQRHRYRRLLQKLTQYCPIIRRLGLTEPPIPLGEVA